MAKITITEALAEIKTAQARIAKKREAVMRYFSRDSKLRDPLEQEGGSKEYVRKERQSIKDLEQRIVRIRSAIQAKNLETQLPINGTTRTLTEWLNWRREIANGQRMFLAQMAGQVSQVRQHALRQGAKVTDSADGYAPGDVVIAVGEQDLAKESEDMEAILSTLDGKLSLLNATVQVEVD